MHKNQLMTICEMKKKLICEAECAVNGPAEQCNINVLGATVDMIKDLAEAEYYMSITNAMEEYDEEAPELQGYNGRRYANGHFAPAGHGHMMGYIETPHNRMMSNKPEHYYNRDMMGYNKTADMQMNADEHIMNSVNTIKEIWKNADPQLKERIKRDVTPLVNEMNM